MGKKHPKIETIPIVRDEIGRIKFPRLMLATFAERLLDVLFATEPMKGDFMLETERDGRTLIIWQRRDRVV